MLHSDYSDYALLYNSLIALPKSDCFQVKPNKLQKSAGVAHMLKMQHHKLLIFIFSMMTQRFMRIMKDGGDVIVLVRLFVSRITHKVMGRFA